MLSLLRSGNTGVNGYGVIDNLTFTYTGNQLRKTDDAATDPSTNLSMDFRENNVHLDVEYLYDGNGNQTKDLNKGIDKIEYNFLNLPRRIEFSQTGRPINEYVYSAAGAKLSVIHRSSTEKRTDYVGNMIYENGSLKRILVDGGYIENGQYYFYIQDHLGNNRVVVDKDGAPIQVNHYYPFGMSFAEGGADRNKQPYQYNGKELDTENGLNWYDYGARMMDGIRFTTMDRYAEKYYSISPYQYAANNPMNIIDINGDSLSISQSTSVQDVIMTIYNGLQYGTHISMKWNNGVLDPASIEEQAKSSSDFFLQDLYEIASSKKMVELSFGMDNNYRMNGQEVREYWGTPYDDDDGLLGNKEEWKEIGIPIGKHIQGNLGQTLVPNAFSTSSGKRSIGNNIEVIINNKGSLNHKTVGLAHEFGHVLLYLRGKPFSHTQPGVDSFIDSRTKTMSKRLGYDY